jgi:serine/threonine protein kinase
MNLITIQVLALTMSGLYALASATYSCPICPKYLPTDKTLPEQCWMANEFSRSQTPLGQGAFGAVRKVGYKNQMYAIKKVQRPTDDVDATLISNEMAMMSELKDSPYTIKYLGCSLHEDDIYLALDYIDGSDLKGQPIAQTLSGLKGADLLRFWLPAFNGLRDMHAKNILHNDIKPENLMLTRDLKRLIFIDFGFSNLLTDENKVNKGTELYMPRTKSKINRIFGWTTSILWYLQSSYRW